MKRLSEKPCRICGESVIPAKRTDRNAYYYPRQCKKCFHVSRNPEERKRRIGIAMGGMNHPKAVPLFAERIVNRKGINYVIIKVFSAGKWFYKHRWVMEQHLSYSLKKWEVVHHIDGDTLNNNIENLKVMNNKCHSQLHSVINTWSIDHVACISCGTTSKEHEGNGLCTTCYNRQKERKPRTINPNRWSMKYQCCQVCHTTDKIHKGLGLCYVCFQRQRAEERGYWRKPKAIFEWSFRFPECIQCHSTKFKHQGHGLCTSCYKKDWHAKTGKW